jgi:hypothetical protein
VFDLGSQRIDIDHLGYLINVNFTIYYEQFKIIWFFSRLVAINTNRCHSCPCFRRGKLVPAKAGSRNPGLTA